MQQLRWGILSTAKIGVEKVIPAMQKSALGTVQAIASQSEAKAREAASTLNIPTAHGSYEALLEDPEVDAIYNPLPNHMHIDWSIRALNAGKHVLCEKPLSNTCAEVQRLIDAQKHTGLVAAEAFMVMHTPQWQKAQTLVHSGVLGELHSVQGHFFYNNRETNNIRNNPAYLGGAMLDIGVYPLLAARVLFGSEPVSVVAAMEPDPTFQVDRLSSVILRFATGLATFTVGTQTVPCQRVVAFGDKKRLEMDIPFNPLPAEPSFIRVFGASPYADFEEELLLDASDQYTLQADNFARAVFDGTPLPMSLEDSLKHMKVIEAIFRSSVSGSWEHIGADV